MLKNLFILIALFSSCAHYRLKDKNNPFAQYQISKLYIPMFYNQSNFPGVNGILTQKIYQTLAQYNQLKIVSKASEADAALVGIVESPQSMREAISTNSTKSAKNTYSEVLKDTDKDYIIPSVNEVNLSLTVGYDDSVTDFSYVITNDINNFQRTAFTNSYNIKPEITYSFSKYVDGNFYINHSITKTHTTGRKKETDIGFRVRIIFESFN